LQVARSAEGAASPRGSISAAAAAEQTGKSPKRRASASRALKSPAKSLPPPPSPAKSINTDMAEETKARMSALLSSPLFGPKQPQVFFPEDQTAPMQPDVDMATPAMVAPAAALAAGAALAANHLFPSKQPQTPTQDQDAQQTSSPDTGHSVSPSLHAEPGKLPMMGGLPVAPVAAPAIAPGSPPAPSIHMPVPLSMPFNVPSLPALPLPSLGAIGSSAVTTATSTSAPATDDVNGLHTLTEFALMELEARRMSVDLPRVAPEMLQQAMDTT
jgi:hypothetical protein